MDFDHDVFGLGQCVVDRIGRLAVLPAGEGKLELEDLAIACGGPAATACVALSRWGRACAFGGVVGDDEAGRRIRTDLASEGVDTSHLLVRAGTQSQFSFVAVERGTGRRRIYWRRPSGAPPAPAEFRDIKTRVLLTDGLYAEAALALAADAGHVVVDAGTLRDGTRALIPHAHMFVASESFARDWVGADDPAGAVRRLRELGVEVAGVTLGERGYVAGWGDRIEAHPPYEVTAIDTTGCGDVFHAGLVEGLLSGWRVERWFHFAAWAAAQVATRVGTRDGIPDRADRPDDPAVS